MTQKPTSRDDLHVVVVFQGGGSLGAYHIGAYQALEEAGYRPDWVSGISIGAFTAALVAGNPPDKRLERLEEFWQTISWPGTEWGSLLSGPYRRWFNLASHATAIAFGQPGFFAPRSIPPSLGIPGTPEALSHYSTTPMRSTLRRLVDFDLINNAKTRLSLGAARVRDGELVFFDNLKEKIGPEHVLASGSLPPAFAPTLVGDELYWDGGCVTNTPLNAIIEERPRQRMLVFMIDLFDAAGPEPRNMDDVNWRGKSIQYASRTSHHIEQLATKWNMRRAMSRMAKRVSADASSPAAFADLADAEPVQRLDIVHITYERDAEQISNSDAEFSRASIAERRAHGYRDMKRAVESLPQSLSTTEGMPAAFSGDDLDLSGECAVVHRVSGSKVDSKVHMP